MHGVAAEHAHEVSDLLQMPQRILRQVVCQVAHKVHVEEVPKAPPAHCTSQHEKDGYQSFHQLTQRIRHPNRGLCTFAFHQADSIPTFTVSTRGRFQHASKNTAIL